LNGRPKGEPHKTYEQGDLAREPIGKKASLNSTNEGAQLKHSSHETTTSARETVRDSPLVKTTVDFWKLVQKARHNEDNRDETLIKAEKKTTNTGSQGAGDNDPRSHEVLEAYKSD
jgi:hypothetical protein